MFDSFPAQGNVLIQGGSRGLGLGFVRMCLAEPKVGRVIAACRTPATASALAQLAAQQPGRLTIVALDASDEPSIAAAAAATVSASWTWAVPGGRWTSWRASWVDVT